MKRKDSQDGDEDRKGTLKKKKNKKFKYDAPDYQGRDLFTL